MKVGDKAIIYERRFGLKKEFSKGIYLGEVLTLINYSDGIATELIKTFKVGNCIITEKNCEWKLLKKNSISYRNSSM